MSSINVLKNIESNIELGTHNEVELLKKEKLRLKDAMYEVLKRLTPNKLMAENARVKCGQKLSNLSLTVAR